MGFTLNSAKICVSCENLENSFLIGGICAFCPGGQVYNKKTKKCECPAGKFSLGINQVLGLIGKQNLCYSCPINEINEIIENGKCICPNSY